MASYFSKQVAKIATRNREGDSKLLAFEHSFDRFYESDYTKVGKTLEINGLDRYLIKLNHKTKSGTVQLKANLPLEELDRIYLISEDLMLNEKKGLATSNLVIYGPPAKYYRNDKNEKGDTLCYQIKISYQAAMNTKIKFEIKNFYAPVTEKSDGTTQIGIGQMTGEKNASIFISTDEWFDTINHLRKLCDSNFYSSHEKRLIKSFVPVEKK